MIVVETAGLSKTSNLVYTQAIKNLFSFIFRSSSYN